MPDKVATPAGKLPKWAIVVAALIGVAVVYFLFRGKKGSSSDSGNLTPAFAPTGNESSTFGGGFTSDGSSGGDVTPTTGGGGPGGGDTGGGCSASGGWLHTGCLKVGSHCTGTAQCPCGQKCHKNGPLDLTGQCGPRPCTHNHQCRPSSSGPAHCNTQSGFCECDTVGGSGTTAQTASATGSVSVAA